MDIFRYDTKNKGIFDITEGKKVKDFKRVIKMCTKPCLDFDQDFMTQEDKECLKNCVSKYY